MLLLRCCCCHAAATAEHSPPPRSCFLRNNRLDAAAAAAAAAVLSSAGTASRGLRRGVGVVPPESPASRSASRSTYHLDITYDRNSILTSENSGHGAAAETCILSNEAARASANRRPLTAVCCLSAVYCLQVARGQRS